MCKKFLSTLIVAAVLSSTSYTALADNLSQTEKSHEQHKAQFQQLSKEITDLNAEISGLTGQIESLNNKLKKNNAEIDKVQGDIKETEVKLDETKKELENQQNVFGSRMRNIYKQGSSSNKYLEVLLTSKDLSDFLSRANAITTMLTLDKKAVNEIDAKKEAINKAITDLNGKEKKLNELKEATEKDRNELNEKKNKQEVDLAELNKQKAQVAAVIEANEKELIAHSLSIISSSNDVNSIKSAIQTLKQIMPQLSSDSVISTAKNAIKNANNKIEEINKANEAKHVSSSNYNNVPNRGQAPSGKTMMMEATAYSDGLLTATGFRPSSAKNGLGTIAVDPRVIPLGSKVYIEGYGYAHASDTGGVIKGNIIDLYMDSHAECISWGRRQVKVTIVAYPGQW